jgi:hypothetical protein
VTTRVGFGEQRDRTTTRAQTDLPPWQIKSAPLAAANQRDWQITSDYPK